jgi:hypothetical protein
MGTDILDTIILAIYVEYSNRYFLKINQLPGAGRQLTGFGHFNEFRH